MTLEGKTVLITGAARRIGRALAIAVAQHGGDVIIHYGRSKAQAEGTQAEIRSLGREASLLQANLADPTQVMQLLHPI